MEEGGVVFVAGGVLGRDEVMGMGVGKDEEMDLLGGWHRGCGHGEDSVEWFSAVHGKSWCFVLCRMLKRREVRMLMRAAM